MKLLWYTYAGDLYAITTREREDYSPTICNTKSFVLGGLCVGQSQVCSASVNRALRKTPYIWLTVAFSRAKRRWANRPLSRGYSVAIFGATPHRARKQVSRTTDCDGDDHHGSRERGLVVFPVVRQTSAPSSVCPSGRTWSDQSR